VYTLDVATMRDVFAMQDICVCPLAIEVAVGVTNPPAVSAKREIRGGRFHATDRLTAWSQRKSLCVCARKIRLSMRKTKTRSAGFVGDELLLDSRPGNISCVAIFEKYIHIRRGSREVLVRFPEAIGASRNGFMPPGSRETLD